MAQQSKIKPPKDQNKEIESLRDSNKLKNNKKQIEWRRNKVRQLLLRRNTQSEISRTLHISQPTISRDIDYIKSKYITNSKNTYRRLSEEYINISLGIDEMKSKNIMNSNQQVKDESVSKQKVNQSSINNTNVLNNTNQNLNKLNQIQLVDLIASTISNTNNIDKNKIVQSINDMIEPTKAKGGNVIDSLNQIAEVILKDPSGSVAIKIVNVAKTK